MNIIRELAIKYDGRYNEDLAKNVTSPIGKIAYQPQSANLEIGGSKINISLNDVGGAMPVSEPIRIKLYLNSKLKTELQIYPKSRWRKIIDKIIPGPLMNLNRILVNQFMFKGELDLIHDLLSDDLLLKYMSGERVYIQSLATSEVSCLMLTPEHGLPSIDVFEKYIDLLKLIERKMVA